MAKTFIRRFVKWFFISLNLLASAVFLLACLSPFLNPSRYEFIGFLALVVPYVAILLVFFLIFWLIVKPVRALIPVVTLLLGWKQLSVTFAWHFSKEFTEEHKPDSSIRIVTWNVRGMYGLSKSSYTQTHNRTEIAGLINRLDPDIVCLQEFNNKISPKDLIGNNIGLFIEKYPYYYFSRDDRNKTGTFTAGNVVFSRYPIIDSAKIKLPGTAPQSLIYTDILKGVDTIRIFTTHLQSYQFTASDYKDIAKIKDQDEEALKASENIYIKMRTAYYFRGQQADLVRDATQNAPYPSILCGDFNDVPNSYTYFQLRNKRQDAFLSSSFGIGGSYNALAPTLRIDYILPNRDFRIQQFEMIDEGLSDHHLLVSDVSLLK